MTSATAIVVTSISAPNRSLRALADGSQAHGFNFLVVGDTKSPTEFELDGCDFYPIDRQRSTGFAYAQLCPTRSYTRKNIGYLLAIRAGAPLIIETDDDNIPRPEFWAERKLDIAAPTLNSGGWVNVYSYFCDVTMWPRGLPLDAVHDQHPAFDALEVSRLACPIQQGLADGDPDVDAVYRLLLPLPQNFRKDRRLILGSRSWCPFNSQNTTWWPQAYPLLYLPAHCSFRMTDIWRSFVAQRIAWENGWSILFHEPTVWQDRNDHYLMRDFADEVPGYLNNRAMGAALAEVHLKGGVDQLAGNLRICYEALIRRGWIGAQEMDLLNAWISDLAELGAS
ncbi:MAG TPA: STELLO glycosyltransferase family protein [Chthoniobacterales bacterium]|nr:STELLO glycosyltransferase family protein [Chthoniobacterales bacterium]